MQDVRRDMRDDVTSYGPKQGTDGEDREGGRRAAGLFAVAAACWALFVYRAWGAYPSPHMDEAWWLGPISAFGDHLDFTSALVDPGRALHWMPVGYHLLAGLFVKLTGLPPLAGAKAFSAVLYVVLLVAAWRLARRLPVWPALALFGALCSLPCLTLSLTIRMEVLIALIAVLMLGAMLERRVASALALALVAPLVHPNGAYLSAITGLLILATARGATFRTALWASLRHGRWQIAVAAACVLGYGVYEALHLEAVTSDMGYNVSRKLSRQPSLTDPIVAATALAGIGAALLVARGRRWADIVVLAYGITLAATRVIAQELWYTPLYVVGIALVAGAAASALLRGPVGIPARSPGWPQWLRAPGVRVSALAPLLAFALSAGVVGWHGYRVTMPNWAGEDRAFVARLVDEVKDAKAAGKSLSCVPWFECMTLMNRASDLPRLVGWNPITDPPAGDLCVIVERRVQEPNPMRVESLARGPIVGHTVRACPSDWPRTFPN